MAHRRMTGFTLMEVMIVVVIVGILMLVALPGYQNSLQKGRRADAMAALQDAAARQEKYLLDRSTYTRDLEALGFAEDPYISPDKHYEIEVSEETETCQIESCYELTATPLASSPQIKDTRCTKFKLESNGRRTAEGSTATECW